MHTTPHHAGGASGYPQRQVTAQHNAMLHNRAFDAPAQNAQAFAWQQQIQRQQQQQMQQMREHLLAQQQMQQHEHDAIARMHAAEVTDASPSSVPTETPAQPPASSSTSISSPGSTAQQRMMDRKDALKSQLLDERRQHHHAAPADASEPEHPGSMFGDVDAPPLREVGPPLHQGGSDSTGATGMVPALANEKEGKDSTLAACSTDSFNVTDISTEPIESVDTLQDAIRQWLTLDGQMKQLQNAVKERRKLKTMLDANIIEFMKHNQIPHFDLNKGKLSLAVSTCKKPLNKQWIANALTKFSLDDKQREEMQDMIFNQRPTVRRDRLKHVALRSKK